MLNIWLASADVCYGSLLSFLKLETSVWTQASHPINTICSVTWLEWDWISWTTHVGNVSDGRSVTSPWMKKSFNFSQGNHFPGFFSPLFFCSSGRFINWMIFCGRGIFFATILTWCLASWEIMIFLLHSYVHLPHFQCSYEERKHNHGNLQYIVSYWLPVEPFLPLITLGIQPATPPLFLNTRMGMRPNKLKHKYYAFLGLPKTMVAQMVSWCSVIQTTITQPKVILDLKQKFYPSVIMAIWSLILTLLHFQYCERENSVSRFAL